MYVVGKTLGGDDADLKASSELPDLNATSSFCQLIQTLSKDAPISPAIIKFGLLTYHLTPYSDSICTNLDAISIENTPDAVVPTKTLRAVRWIIFKKSDHLDPNEKKRVGELIENTNLNRPVDQGNDKKATTQVASKQSHIQLQIFERDQPKDLQKDSEKPSHKCPHCSTVYKRKSLLESHKKTCAENPSQKRSDSKNNRNGSTDGLYKCSICSATYDSRSQLSRHKINTHKTTQNKKRGKYQCKHCSKAFSSKRAHTKHVNVCSYQRSDANSTESSQRGRKKTYECKYCQTDFASSRVRNEHQNDCSERPSKDSVSENSDRNKKEEYECRYCQKEFLTKQYRDKHKKKCSENPNKESSNEKYPTGSVGKSVRKDNRGERISGKNPFADPDRLKDAGLHQGGG